MSDQYIQMNLPTASDSTLHSQGSWRARNGDSLWVTGSPSGNVPSCTSLENNYPMFEIKKKNYELLCILYINLNVIN